MRIGQNSEPDFYKFTGLLRFRMNLRHPENTRLHLITGTYRQTNLINKSSAYLAKREELRLAEIELMSSARTRRRAAPQSSRRCSY